MTANRKYAAGISFMDYVQWCQEVAVEHDLLVQLTIAPLPAVQNTARATITLTEIRTLQTSGTPIKTRQTQVKLRGEGQWAEVLNLGWNVLLEYVADPWNWTRRDRIRETTHDGPLG